MQVKIKLQIFDIHYNGLMLFSWLFYPLEIKMKLYRQKEQLKKDILKKRIVLEKTLQIEIQQELQNEIAKQNKNILDEDTSLNNSKNTVHDKVNLSEKR